MKEKEIARQILIEEHEKLKLSYILLPEDWQIDAMIRFKNYDKPVVERYFANSNTWSELSHTAIRSIHANVRSVYTDHKMFDYKHGGYGYFKISGYQYRIKIL